MSAAEARSSSDTCSSSLALPLYLVRALADVHGARTDIGGRVGCLLDKTGYDQACGALLFHGHVDLPRNSADPVHRLHNLAMPCKDIAHRPADPVDLFRNLIGRAARLPGKFFDFASNGNETMRICIVPDCLDLGVQRKEVGLAPDIVDHIDDVPYFRSAIRQSFHLGRGRIDHIFCPGAHHLGFGRHDR